MHSARLGTYGYQSKDGEYVYSSVAREETSGETGAPPLLAVSGAVAPALEGREKPLLEAWTCRRECQGFAHVLCRWLNLLLVFVPLGIFAHYAGWNSAAVFGCNFMAIVPLAGILGAATESLAVHTGQMIGGLLNASLGNAVELIVTINAIRANLIDVVQGSLLGSVLSNMLLVMGMAFFAAGCVTKESTFSARGAIANMHCLTLGSLALALPTLYNHIPDTSKEDVLTISRISSIIIAIVYIMFLVFQLITHADMFMSQEEEDEQAPLSIFSSLALLVGATCAVAYCSEFLVDSIEGVSEQYGLPKAFIGVILLPIVGNAAEHATAVTVAAKGKMDLSIGVAIGSSTQIALFVVPFSVICGMVYDVPMSLDFRVFDSTVFILSVFLVTNVLHDGVSNWLDGAMLVATYVMIAVICWFIPEHQA